MASFKDVAAALGLEPGATPDDAIAAVARIKAEVGTLAERCTAAEAKVVSASTSLEAMRTEHAAMLERFAALNEQSETLIAHTRSAIEVVFKGLGLPIPSSPEEAEATLRGIVADLVRAREHTTSPAEDGKRYFAIVKIQAGEWGTYEPGEMLDPEHATKIVRGMTDGEQFRTE